MAFVWIKNNFNYKKVSNKSKYHIQIFEAKHNLYLLE